MKSIKELALNISEPEYRKIQAFSYSMLAKFLRAKDPKSLLDTTKQDSEALRFGSLVDCLLTEPETLGSRFCFTDAKTPPPSLLSVITYIYDKMPKAAKFSDIPDQLKLEALDHFEYGTSWQSITRLKRVNEYALYYSLLQKAEGKTVVSSEELARATSCVETLRNHFFTRKYINDEDFSVDTMERLYQLKFSSEYQGSPIKCMFDKIIVDHENKTILPIDLKTTGSNEEDFCHSALTWDYFIQANMYSQILLDNILKDEYFKDFELLPFRFVVINKYNLTPLVWKYRVRIEGEEVIDPQQPLLSDHGYKSWRHLVKEAAWHFRTQKFDYSYASYMANGERTIEFKELLY